MCGIKRKRKRMTRFVDHVRILSHNNHIPNPNHSSKRFNEKNNVTCLNPNPNTNLAS